MLQNLLFKGSGATSSTYFFDAKIQNSHYTNFDLSLYDVKSRCIDPDKI